MRKENREQEESEVKVGGCRKKVLGDGAEAKRRVGAKKERKGREEETGMGGKAWCNDRETYAHTG